MVREKSRLRNEEAQRAPGSKNIEQQHIVYAEHFPVTRQRSFIIPP